MFASVTLSRETKTLLLNTLPAIKDRQNPHSHELNRHLLLDVYPAELRPEPRKQYLHLFDGGPTDNLGLETLKTAAYQYLWEAEHNGANRDDIQCLFISIDAYVDPQLATKQERFQGDTRRAFDFFFDRNAIAATDMLLALRRTDTLRNAGKELGLINPVTEFELKPREWAHGPKCLLWHITFDRLSSIWLELPPDSKIAMRSYHHKLKNIISRIETHYKLTGLQHCSPDQLQSFLVDAARILVHDDPSLWRLYDWFGKAGIPLQKPDTPPIIKTAELNVKFDGERVVCH